jgi:protein FAM32A
VVRTDRIWRIPVDKRKSENGMSSAKKPLVVGGKLKLKSSGPTSSSKSILTSQPPSNSSSSSSSSSSSDKKRKLDEASPDTLSTESSKAAKTLESDVHLTDAQKRFLAKQREREKQEAKKLAKSTFRERIENFNTKLSKLSEHNDIPRISAAGNG